MKKEKVKVKKCIVLSCQNKSDQGAFSGDFCFPCYDFITKGLGRNCAIYYQVVDHFILSIAHKLLRQV